MLPDFLFSTYKQYKADTDKIATWLAETAKNCGYKLASADNASQGETSGQNGKTPKLKGRARKLARDAAVTQKKTAPCPLDHDVREQKYTVPIKDFVPMAEQIARSDDPSLKIPAGFIKLMKRCIKTRKGTTDWFEEKVDLKDKDNNDRHSYFADVLHKTLQTLVSRLELETLDQVAEMKQRPLSTGIPVGDRSTALVNAFSLLQVDDTEDFDQATAHVASESSTSPAFLTPRVRYEVEQPDEDDGEEWFFALHCFFADMHELRVYLGCLWNDYIRGEVDLASVAVTTNTAYDLVRRAEDDFNRTMRIPKEYAGMFPDGKVVELYHVDSCMREGLEPRPTPGAIVDLEKWSIVKESFQLPYRLLVSFCGGIAGNRNSMPVTRPAWLGQYDPNADRSSLSPDEMCQQDSALLSDFLATVGPYMHVADTPNTDELSNGLLDMYSSKEGKIPLWLIFAAQSFLDTHHVLKDKANMAFDDLYDFSASASSTLEQHFAFVGEHGLIGYRNKKSEAYTRETKNEIREWVLEDKMTKILNEEVGTRQQKPGRLNKARVWKPNELLKMHPLLCGMIKYSFHLQLQWEGVRLLNETLIMSAAHLYNALKQCRYLPKDCRWEDMETVLTIHSHEDIFYGEYPTTIEDCTKRIAMSQGVSPQTFAKNRRGNQPRIIYSKTGGRALKQATPIADVFRDRFLTGHDVDLSIQSVEAVLNRRLEGRKQIFAKLQADARKKLDQFAIELKKKKEEPGTILDRNSEEKGQMQDNKPNLQAEVVTHKEANGQAIDHDKSYDYDRNHSAMVRWEKHRQLSIFQFLEELSEGLERESLDLRFDCFSFHRRAYRLLEAIQDATTPMIHRALDAHTAAAVASEEGVPLVPGMIMHMACDPRNAPNMVALKNWIDADDSALKAAAEVMKKFIEEEGSVEADREIEYKLDSVVSGFERDRAFDEENGADRDLSIKRVLEAIGEADNYKQLSEISTI